MWYKDSRSWKMYIHVSVGLYNKIYSNSNRAWLLLLGLLPWYTIFNSSHPRQNGHISTDDTFKSIFINENFCISIWISLSKGPIIHNQMFVQVMACRRIGDKPLPEPMLTPVHRRIYAALGGDELSQVTASHCLKIQHLYIYRCPMFKWVTMAYQLHHGVPG